jgi:hypothetical protein
VADSSLIASTITALATVAAAGGAAFVGVWLGPRRYRSEHMWDEKFKTYTLIFDSMNHLLEEIEHLLDEEIHDNVGLTPGFRSELAETSGKARAELRRQARIGSFIICKEAEELIAKLLSALDKAAADKTYFDHIDRNGAAISAAAKELKTVARRDLKA